MMEAGRTLGPYVLERKLGEGGMGVVWAARHQRIGRLYAIKVLLPELAARKDALARFEREAKALSALGHPNIVQTHDFAIEPDGTAYLVMDLLEGTELARAIGGRPMGAARVRRIAMDVAAGLGAAHRIGLVHRDLKPSNVFLVGQGERERAVLLDFGLAKARDPDAATDPKLADKLTASGMILGTPQYMSPEQAQGLALDARVDVWALGAVMYEMLSGRVAFEGPTIASVFAAILTRDPEPLATVGAEDLAALAMRCLDKDRDRRPADGNAVLAALEAGGSEHAATLPGPIPATAMTPVTPATRAAVSVEDTRPMAGPGRRAWATIAAGAAILVLVGTAGWMTFGPVEPTAAPVPTPPGAPMHGSAESDTGASGGDGGAARDAGTDTGASARDAGTDTGRARAAHVVHAPPAPPTPPVPSSLEGRVPPGMESAPGARELMEAGDRMNEGDWAGCVRALAHAPETLHVLSVQMSCAFNAHDRPELDRVCGRIHDRFPTSPFNQSCASLQQ